MIHRTRYHVAGVSLLIEMRDAPAAAAIEGLCAGWHLRPEPLVAAVTPVPGDEAAAVVVRTAARPIAIPAGLETFDVAGDGVCHTDGRAVYIAIGGSGVTIDAPEQTAIDVCLDGPPPIGSAELTRIVSYALSAALRRRRRFELHSGAVIDPETGGAALLIGPSGSGKSTLTVHLASAGWPFMTDDVILLGEERPGGPIAAWPLRRAFAITDETFAASRFLRARTAIDRLERQIDEKRLFSPDALFARTAEPRGIASTLIFPELTGAARTTVTPLGSSETMTRLLRMSPWACYDRSIAGAHLALLASLATRAKGYAIHAGRDLLDPDAAVGVIAACTRPSRRHAESA